MLQTQSGIIIVLILNSFRFSGYPGCRGAGIEIGPWLMMRQEDNQTASLAWRRFSGQLSSEIYMHCRPRERQAGSASGQAASVYRALEVFLRREKGSLQNIVQEVVFFRNIRRDFEAFRQARGRAFASAGGFPALLPATTFIEQPPLASGADVIISATAMLPREGVAHTHHPSPHPEVRSFSLGEQKHVYAGSIFGTPGAPFDETHSMFCRAEELLRENGMTFHDVVRTWIYLRNMERDYADFNRGRREFFRQRNIRLLPASTGIFGAPRPEKANFLLAVYAIQSPRLLETAAMSTPALNEACMYGSDFSRGMRVAEGNKVALYISGTASVDEEGRTAHPGNFEAQVGRMLWNVETLLAAQKATSGNLLAAVTYLKNAEDAPAFLAIMRDRGLDSLPNSLVHAAVCRADLLCEMEAIAALPLPE